MSSDTKAATMAHFTGSTSYESLAQVDLVVEAVAETITNNMRKLIIDERATNPKYFDKMSELLDAIIEERRRGYSPREAMNVTARRTGRAFIVSALTAISGVAVIAFSTLPLLRDFGLIVAMNVTVALVSALVFLPPMLVWAENRGWVTRGMMPERPPVPTPGAEMPREPVAGS